MMWAVQPQASIDLSPSIPTFASIGAIVITGIITAIVAKRQKPTEWMAAATAAQKAAGEANDKADVLRAEFNDFRDTMETKYRVVTRGFRALWRQLERFRAHWGDGAMPELDVDDLADINAARDILGQQDQ